VLDHLGEVAVGRADDADVDLDRLLPAAALEPPLLEHAQSLVCRPSGSSPTSSRNSVPWSAISNRPACFSVAPGNAPFSCSG
jgi:hypothetical protein